MSRKIRFTILFYALALAGARPAAAFVADAMDTTVGYTAGADSDTLPMTFNNVLVAPGEQSPAIQLNYKFVGSSGFCQAVKDFSVTDLSDLYTGGKFGFSYRWNGPVNTFLVRLMDVNGNFSDYTNASPNNSGAWTRLELLKTDFVPSVSNFDYFRVKSIIFAVTHPGGGVGAGTLDIDKVEMVRDAETASNLVFNNFDSAPFSNAFSQSTGAFVGSGGATNNVIRADLDTTPANVWLGAGSMKITYDFGQTAQTVMGVYSPPQGNLSTYREIEFYAKSDKDGEAFQVAFGSNTVQQAINVGGLTTSWKKFVVKFTNFDLVFKNGLGASSVGQFVFQFVKNLGPDSGTVWIDDVRFVRPVFPGGVVKTLDDMNLPMVSPPLSTWFGEGDAPSGTIFSLSSITDGFQDQALRLTYDLKGGGYAQMHRNWSINASATDNLSFRFKYGGGTNHFQMNIVDFNGVRFDRELKNFTATGDVWNTMVLPLKDFVSTDPNQKTLDLRNIQNVRFTVIKDTGGSGFLALDDFEFGGSVNAVHQDVNKLIRSFSLDHATFSPNGDGVKDTVTFQYTLAEASSVRLRVYDQRGAVVKELDKPAPDPAGTSTLTWDGRGDNGQVVPNGLYFFQFRAESVTSDSKDKFSHLVAVMR